MSLLKLENLTKVYPAKRDGEKYELVAVNGVSLHLEKGKCLGLVGESGCGKSTLGKMITGLEAPTAGQVYLNGNPLVKPGKFRRTGKLQSAGKIQMVFQDSFDAVNPRYSAKKIISEPLQNFFSMSAAEMDQRVEELLDSVGISADSKNKYSSQFSGGQLQRVCIARALAANPDVIILDEPLSSLDVSVQAQILNLLHDLKKSLEVSYILISHDLEAVYYLSDSLAVMYGGKILEQIDDIAMFDRMVHPYTLKLLSSTPTYRNRNTEDSEAEGISVDLGVQKKGYQGCPYAERCIKATEQCRNVCPELTEVEPGHFAACHHLELR